MEVYTESMTGNWVVYFINHIIKVHSILHAMNACFVLCLNIESRTSFFLNFLVYFFSINFYLYLEGEKSIEILHILP